MKLIKGNQVIAISIALLLMVVGYMNYNGEIQSVETAKLLDGEEVVVDNENIGDVQLVSSVSTDKSITDEKNETKNEGVETINSETTETSNSQSSEEILLALAETNEDFENSRIDREKMYSQSLETYQNMLDSESVSNEQKAIASKEIENITYEKKSILIAENLIKTKGFEDVIIFVNSSSVSVIVKAENLDQSQIAQLQNIITREIGVEISNINISNKK